MGTVNSYFMRIDGFFIYFLYFFSKNNIVIKSFAAYNF